MNKRASLDSIEAFEGKPESGHGTRGGGRTHARCRRKLAPRTCASPTKTNEIRIMRALIPHPSQDSESDIKRNNPQFPCQEVSRKPGHPARRDDGGVRYGEQSVVGRPGRVPVRRADFVLVERDIRLAPACATRSQLKTAFPAGLTPFNGRSGWRMRLGTPSPTSPPPALPLHFPKRLRRRSGSIRSPSDLHRKPRAGSSTRLAPV